MYKKTHPEMSLGRNTVPKEEKKLQLSIYEQSQHIELLGGKKQAQDLLKSLFAQAVKNKQNAT